MEEKDSEGYFPCLDEDLSYFEVGGVSSGKQVRAIYTPLNPTFI